MSHISRGSAGGLYDPTDERSNCGVGVVMDLESGPSHDVVSDALSLLSNLEHRGTTGAEENTGDGAGITVQIPHEFLADELDADLSEPYAVGSIFFPREPNARKELRSLIEETLTAHDLTVLDWRDVPTDNSNLGETALESEPHVSQLVVEPTGELAERAVESSDSFERALYVGRRAVEKRIDAADREEWDRFYVCSLDQKIVVYKGLLTGDQLRDYYPDLRDERIVSRFAMVHARFSTNTLGAWHLAHPYRRMVHNGEINTIRGNVNWMRARETDVSTGAVDVEAIKPIVDDPDQSDTASLDNALELLTIAGRDLPHALRMLIPEAWRNPANGCDDDRKAWYDYHASLIEPWDGPALVCATDGDRVGAVLDRNGFRPCRYDLLANGRLVLASEVGALEHDPAEIVERGRLKPGQLFLADPIEGRVIPDDEVFAALTDERYGEWIEENQLRIEDVLGDAGNVHSGETASDASEPNDLRARQAAFGYRRDDVDELLTPMVEDGKDPIGSMGDDTPLSVLSEFDRPLFSYFKQLFAQVTNPPLDYIREELVTSMESRLGKQRNLLAETPEHARQLVLDSPILSTEEMRAIRNLEADGLESAVVDITYEPSVDLRTAIETVREDAVEAIESGSEIVVLSDRAVGPDRVAIPSLLATGAVHHHLVRTGLRNHAGLVVESGEPRTVHHVATLVGYGAGAIAPYLAYETIADLVAGEDGANENAASEDEALETYAGALEDGLLKVMAKMGISTVESYRGAQIFEAVGLDSDVIEACFEGTVNRTEGIGFAAIEEDLLARHAVGFGDDPALERQGEFRHRQNGIHHQWNPQTVRTLQMAVRNGEYETYREFASQINDQAEQLQTLRGLLEFDTDDREPIPIEEVEPAEEIVKRFSTAPMSLGSLSPEAHENNAIAMNRLGAKSNTGEGGEPPERFGTERECSVKQVASARFGVTSYYLASADELQIKMAQGSKPGEGGHLPGKKVNEMIADVRCATPGVGLISPPPLHDIYSIEDLKQLIHDLKVANEDADVNVKLVSEAGIGTIAAGVAKANADAVHISGHSGGTGASPLTSIKSAGLPWELGLAEANQMLRETGLRSRIRVSVDGGMKTGRDVAIGALLGAEEYVFGTASLVTSGCVMARQCQNNTCPVGIATQRGDLRERFPGEPDHVINYMLFIAEELREIMAELGFRTVEEMVGRVDLLRQRQNVSHPKARRVDLSTVLFEPRGDDRTKTREQTHDVESQLDRTLIEAAVSTLEGGEPVSIDARIENTDRTVGAMLSNRVSRRYGDVGLPDDSITLNLRGTAGQSLGAFLAPGLTIRLTGAANDYVGKGLSGGKIVIETPETAAFTPEENVLVGNVSLYGATDGECYVNGVAGERFAVRNSGATAVVEGVGDHGCEYMTGGVVCVLGETGKNFAAGMSGGVAYVYDEDGRFGSRANTEMVSLSTDLDDRDERLLRRLVENHATYTGSERALALLERWDDAIAQFVMVMPDAYHHVITEEGRTDVRAFPPSPAAEPVESGRVEPAGAD